MSTFPETDSRRNLLYSDDPTDVDALNRGAFALSAVRVLRTLAESGKSSVAALIGPWGSGKSSTLGDIRKGLEQAGVARVVVFSPWLFSGVEGLTENFFTELASAMPGKKYRHLRKQIGGYVTALSPIGTVGSLAGLDVSSIIKAIGSKVADQGSIEERRDELSRALAKESATFVIIDDLDRLQPDELLNVLRLIRLVGRLPNIHYLLAFDERTILDALQSTAFAGNDIGRAARYLEKIVQVRLDLPILSRIQQTTQFDRYMELFERSHQAETEQRDKNRLTQAYALIMEKYLDTPRALKRYFTQLDAFYPDVAGEVNTVDFLLITYIRVAHSAIYSRLPEWKELLLGQFSPTVEDFQSQRDKRHRQEWRTRLVESGYVANDDEENMFELLSLLFTSLNSVKDGFSGAGSADHLALAGQRRIGSPDYFDRYFQLVVAEGELSDSEVIQALRSLVGAQPSTEKGPLLLRQVEASPVAALKKIIYTLPQIEVVDPRPLLRELSSRFDKFREIEDSLWAESPQLDSAQIAVSSISRAPTETSASTLELLASHEHLDLGFRAVEVAQRTEPRPSWTTNFTRSVMSLLLERLDRITTLHDLDRDEFRWFYAWSRGAQPQEIHAYVLKRITTGDWKVLDFFALLVPIMVTSLGHGPLRRVGEFDQSYIRSFVDLDVLVDLIGEHLQGVEVDQNLDRKQFPVTFQGTYLYAEQYLAKYYTSRPS